MNFISKISLISTKYFTILVILATVFALSFDELTIFLPYVKILLSLIMFAMGLTIKISDLTNVFKYPKALFLGIVLQYTIMPCAAFFLITLFPVNPEIAIGVMLLGCSPGGTASNVMTFIAKGDIALSIGLTTISTLLSPFITPLLTYFFVHSWVDINISSMFFSISQIVLVPVILGILINRLFEEKIYHILPVLPTISIWSIIIIIMAVVSSNNYISVRYVALLICLVVIHNVFGLILGFYISKVFKLKKKQCKAISIEVGMQNSALAATLAVLHFNPLSALPGAIYSIWHNLSGSFLASIWGRDK
ncbi:MAG: bile acid:sodium symporter family protein [Deferribacterota bacterium]|nr:bile acid:sodium symporter family protein [Deferribacterota bacterium]